MTDGPIALIPEDAIDLTPLEPEFELLAATELGVQGGPEDGFEEHLAEVVEAVGGGSEVVAVLESDVDEAAAQHADLSADLESPLVEDLGTAVSDGDALLGEYDTDIGNIAEETPPAPAAPTTTEVIDINPPLRPKLFPPVEVVP
jgi:hypothetical protein